MLCRVAGLVGSDEAVLAHCLYALEEAGVPELELQRLLKNLVWTSEVRLVAAPRNRLVRAVPLR